VMSARKLAGHTSARSGFVTDTLRCGKRGARNLADATGNE
jgi:hypothetical protein